MVYECEHCGYTTTRRANFLALDGSIPRDLFHELDMDEDNVVDDETEIKNKTRKFDKCTMQIARVARHNHP